MKNNRHVYRNRLEGFLPDASSVRQCVRFLFNFYFSNKGKSSKQWLYHENPDTNCFVRFIQHTFIVFFFLHITPSIRINLYILFTDQFNVLPLWLSRTRHIQSGLFTAHTQSYAGTNSETDSKVNYFILPKKILFTIVLF